MILGSDPISRWETGQARIASDEVGQGDSWPEGVVEVLIVDKAYALGYWKVVKGN
jgi:hypothetical protein